MRLAEVPTEGAKTLFNLTNKVLNEKYFRIPNIM
jgi:hypothetical protein